MGVDAALEREADRLLGEAAIDGREHGDDGRSVLTFGALESAESWMADVPTGDYSLRAVMSAVPHDLPANRPRARFRWSVGQGGYAPLDVIDADGETIRRGIGARDSVVRYRTLGNVKMMRLALLAEHLAAADDVTDGLLLGRFPRTFANVLRRRVNRWMGAPTPLDGTRDARPSDRRTAHHAGAGGRRRTAAAIAALGEGDGMSVMTAERMAALMSALAVGGQTWADRVDA